MPNYVRNIVRVSDNFENIDKQTNSLDFEKIAPIPKELENTASPAIIVEETQLNLKEHNKHSRPITKEMSAEYIKNFGYNNWYDWNCANWGTKWNRQSVDTSSGYWEFDTAWSTPLQLVSILSQKYPSEIFTVEYADEDIGSNCGKYQIQNGILLYKEQEDNDFAARIWGYDSYEDMQKENDYEEEDEKIEVEKPLETNKETENAK